MLIVLNLLVVTKVGGKPNKLYIHILEEGKKGSCIHFLLSNFNNKYIVYFSDNNNNNNKRYGFEPVRL